MPQRIFSIRELRPFTGGAHPATVYRWISQGQFPPPDFRTPNKVGWTEATLDRWQAEAIKRGVEAA